MTTFIPPDYLATPSFVLRSYHAGDGEMFADAVNSSGAHLREFLPWAERPLSLEVAERRVRDYHAKFLRNEGFTLGVFAPDERELWGGTGYNLWECPPEWGNAEIGMWIRASRAGHGLGTAVLEAMIRWGFTEWQWTRLSWKTDSTNIASRRTAERAGMTFEGTHRHYFPGRDGKPKGDAMVYAITKPEWEA